MNMEMAFLGTHFSIPKPHKSICCQHNLHQIKPFNSVQSSKFRTAHLSISSFRCLSQRQRQSTQNPLTQEEKEEGNELQKMEVQRNEFERLFSNLNQATLKHEPGSLSSSISLVAGTTVGAGILAIPAVTQESGFLASAVACIGCWAFMVVTGLLIAEININTMCELGSGGVSLVSMARRTIGSVGVQVACWSYIFIHYALLVAYISRSSNILTNYLGIPHQRFIGAVNGLLVLGIITSFTALVVIASGNLHFDALLKANFEAVPSSIPVIALAFVYHNVVPVLCTNLEGDLSKDCRCCRNSYSSASVSCLEWGNTWYIGKCGFRCWRILDPLQQLRSSNGVVGPIVETFSLFAIGTSYIGFVLGLADFLADLLKLPSGQSKTLPYLITLIPPLVLSQLDPEIFFKALDFAGTYGAMSLVRSTPDFSRAPESAPGGPRRKAYSITGDGWRCMDRFVRITQYLQSHMKVHLLHLKEGRKK
ncbi:Tyrosine-specific transport protein [Bienertia sinuspersici]